MAWAMLKFMLGALALTMIVGTLLGLAVYSVFAQATPTPRPNTRRYWTQAQCDEAVRQAMEHGALSIDKVDDDHGGGCRITVEMP